MRFQQWWSVGWWQLVTAVIHGRKGMQSGISIRVEAYDVTLKIRNSRLSPYFCSSACPWFW